MLHACYVCHRITVAGMPVSDLPPLTPETEPENVSHGVCLECQPAEMARMLSELEALSA